VSLRLPIVVCLTLCACRDHNSSTVRPSPLETAIARDLTARVQAPVSATCAIAGSIAKCQAVMFDGTKLPIEVKSEHDEWQWHVAALVIDTLPIAEHVNATLAVMKLPRRASCGKRIQIVQPGDRISCMVAGGGMAFVRVGERGDTTLELALDAASVAARTEPVTPERDRELTKMSADLETLEGESDGEEEVVHDGGVPNP
jgi:hypothetical protein